jgi:hypothetical protein
VITPTDMENMPPEKITDIGYIHNSNAYLKYTAYKNFRYQIYPQVDPNLVYSQLKRNKMVIDP